MNSNSLVNESSLYRIQDQILRNHVKPSHDPPKDYLAKDPDSLDYTPQIYEETLRERLEAQNSATSESKSSECVDTSVINLATEEDFAIYKAMKVSFFFLSIFLITVQLFLSSIFPSVPKYECSITAS